jgi:two-component system nitrate/nitrite response regulator NarL
MGIRILIADRQDMFRDALRRLIERESDFAVVGDTGDGDQLLKMIAELKPDVLLFDLRLHKRSGTELLQEIGALETDMRPILLLDSVGKNDTTQMLLLGVRGIVLKHEPTQLLFKCIRTIMQGEYWISRRGVVGLVQNLRSLTAKVAQSSKHLAQNLSPQQQQIVEAIIAGCSNKEIAKDLKISERTVKYHLTRIFGKLGVSGRMQLAQLTLKNGSADSSN